MSIEDISPLGLTRRTSHRPDWMADELCLWLSCLYAKALIKYWQYFVPCVSQGHLLAHHIWVFSDPWESMQKKRKLDEIGNFQSSVTCSYLGCQTKSTLFTTRNATSVNKSDFRVFALDQVELVDKWKKIITIRQSRLTKRENQNTYFK